MSRHVNFMRHSWHLRTFLYLNVIYFMCCASRTFSPPFGSVCFGVIAVGLVSADQALLDPPLLSVTTSWETYSISPSLLSRLQTRGTDTSLSGFLWGWRLDTSVRPLAWWLAQMGLSAHGLHHKATPQLLRPLFPDVAFFRASCWQWRWIFQSVTTGHLPMPGPSWDQPKLGRQGPPETRGLIDSPLETCQSRD